MKSILTGGADVIVKYRDRRRATVDKMELWVKLCLVPHPDTHIFISQLRSVSVYLSFLCSVAFPVASSVGYVNNFK